MQKGLRTFTRLVVGSDQRSFFMMPIQIVVAVSDGGTIRRAKGWKEQQKPFRTFVSKADLVTAKVWTEFKAHRSAASLIGKPDGSYGMWAMKPEEVSAVAEFLVSQHSESSGPQAVAEDHGVEQTTPTPEHGIVAPSVPACKACGGGDLSARWGRYGYYWKCGGCGVNTAMPRVCSACGVDGAGSSRGAGNRADVRIRQDGPAYFRRCEACGADERIWLER